MWCASLNSCPIDLVQQGLSEKVALSVNFISAFVAGYILAYVQSWRLALALTSILPWMMMAGAVMNIFIGKYMR
jgi:ATP-binding cassette subfamily B (MDR/TAP) protein 1